MKRPAAQKGESPKRPRHGHECGDTGPSRYAITFGEVALLHVGGKELGTLREKGFSVAELRELASSLSGFRVELVMLSDALPEKHRKENEAATLVIRNGAAAFLGGDAAQKLLGEQQALKYDFKYWDARRSRTLNKRARYNLVFAEEGAQPSADFKQYTVQAFGGLPHLAAFRAMLPQKLGEKARDLCAEGNHYFDESTGIGFHGDSERKIVVCLSLGRSSILRYCWRMPGSSTNGPPIDIEIHHGDVYVMSEKATGFDWRSRSKVRVVHAAGSDKYIG